MMDQASALRWTSLVTEPLPGAAIEFLELKWSLPPGWFPGNPPRPISVDQMLEAVDATAEEIRDSDWQLVDRFRQERKRLSQVPALLTVPIDVAGEWWDDEYSGMFYPDGKIKPEDERGSVPPGFVTGERHEIQDTEALIAHLSWQVHGLIYVVGQTNHTVLVVDHNQAHDHEAQDRIWDTGLRPGNGPTS
jgi:hypothetical protein